MNSKDLQFSPDYTPSQLREMGVYGEVYGPKTAPRLASLPQWPEHWYNEADPHGWLQWYNRYSKGRRIDDDERQIKRWLAFKARHGGKMFQENPTPRRAYALRNWAVDPLKLVNDPEKRVELQKAMEEYRAKKYKQAADMEWARQSGGIPEMGEAFNFVKDKVVPGMQQSAFNFGEKAYDAVSNFLKPKQPAAPGGVANAFKPNWAKPQGPRVGIGVPTKTFTGLSSKISNALELYKRAGERPGLWENIRRKRARGEAPAKPDEKGYPDRKQWKRLTSKKAELLKLLEKFASSPAWQRSAGKSPKGGLNATGRASINKLAGVIKSIYKAPKHIQKAYFENPALHRRLSSAGGKAPKAKKKKTAPPLKQTNFDDKLDAVPHEEGLKLFQEGKQNLRKEAISRNGRVAIEIGGGAGAIYGAGKLLNSGEKKASIIKLAKSKILQDLIEAKRLSDDRDFVHKNALLRKVLLEHPKQFKVDSHLNNAYVGLTHKPTGFKIHAQKKIIPSELLT